MNSNLIEQFSNLAKERVPAGLSVDEWIRVYNEELSKLIVLECVRYFQEEYQRDFDILWRHDLSSKILSYFGVENERTN